MDSGNMSEVQVEGAQPDAVVVTESEAAEATPQAEVTEQPTVYIEEEGDQSTEPKDGMDEAQLRAAMREEREKRKRKNAELEEAKRREKELEERLARAEKLAIEAALGKKPSPSDFYDATEYAEALEKYNQKTAELKPSAATQEPKQQEQSANQLSEDQELHAYKSRAELRKHLPDYDQAEARIDGILKQAGLPVEQVKNGLIGLAHLHDIDYAKAIYAFDQLPSLRDELGGAPNDAAIAKVMKKAAGMVKVRQPAKIDTKPEPELNSSGSVHATSQEVAKLRQEWVNGGGANTYAKYAAAKAKLREANNG